MSVGQPRTEEPGRDTVHVYHESFDWPDAEKNYDPRAVLNASAEFAAGYMPAEACWDCAERMHYTEYRASRATHEAARRKWIALRKALRDRILLGNQKLVYKAIRYRKAWQRWADDLAGEGFLVLIHAVDSFNPWYGVRFGSYAFTCLIRAFVRRAHLQALAARRFAELAVRERPVLNASGSELSPETFDWERYLRSDHPLLSEREKCVLCLRFGLCGEPALKLAALAQHFRLSQERVRQIQVVALTKLRGVVAHAHAAGALT